jgi:RNA polymerase sigma factor for flagellar operon FliA
MKIRAAYANKKLDQQEQLVIRHADLVKRIAQHLAARLPASVRVEDLVQAGMIGLLEAARNYDATQGASFETYAGIRIRGAMLDETRKSDWAPRSVHRKAREAAESLRVLEHRLQREPTAAEVAQAMNISLDEYHEIMVDAAGCRVFSLDEPDEDSDETWDVPGSDSDNPFAQVENADFRQALIEVIEHLPEKEKLVMSLYYDEELNLREIGQVLGVSESRVCQIHGQALTRIRARMADWT